MHRSWVVGAAGPRGGLAFNKCLRVSTWLGASSAAEFLHFSRLTFHFCSNHVNIGALLEPLSVWKNKRHAPPWWNHPGLEGCLAVFTSHLLLVSCSIFLIFGYLCPEAWERLSYAVPSNGGEKNTWLLSLFYLIFPSQVILSKRKWCPR